MLDIRVSLHKLEIVKDSASRQVAITSTRHDKSTKPSRQAPECQTREEPLNIRERMKSESVGGDEPLKSNPAMESGLLLSTLGQGDSLLRIEGSLVPRRPCEQTCLCQCHKVTNSSTPHAADSVLGKLCIGYVGLPLLSYRHCNRITCRNQNTNVGTRIRITYLFPLWFASKLWALTMWKTSTTFRWKLDFPVIIHTAAPVYVAASLGDIRELQTMLSFNSSLLNAVDATANKTPLQASFNLSQSRDQADNY